MAVPLTNLPSGPLTDDENFSVTLPIRPLLFSAAFSILCACFASLASASEIRVFFPSASSLQCLSCPDLVLLDTISPSLPLPFCNDSATPSLPLPLPLSILFMSSAKPFMPLTPCQASTAPRINGNHFSNILLYLSPADVGIPAAFSAAICALTAFLISSKNCGSLLIAISCMVLAATAPSSCASTNTCVVLSPPPPGLTPSVNVFCSFFASATDLVFCSFLVVSRMSLFASACSLTTPPPLPRNAALFTDSCAIAPSRFSLEYFFSISRDFSELAVPS